MSTPPRLPDTLRVLERGWLSANNVLLFDGDEATLIDSGYVTHAAQTVALLHAALEGRQLGRLVNTHSHSDHIGGNAAVQRAFGCSITVPKGMAQAVADWDETALLLSVIDQAGEPSGPTPRSQRAGASSPASWNGRPSPRPATTWTHWPTTTPSAAS